MFKRILVPIDGSPLALRGAKSAVELAKNNDAEIIALFVAMPFDRYFHASSISPLSQSSKDELAENERSHAQQAIAEVDAFAKAHDVKFFSTIVFNKVPARAILQARQSFNSDLIVMGSHGYRGLKKLILGSTAQEVLAQSDVPVLIYRDSAIEPARPLIDWEADENETP